MSNKNVFKTGRKIKEHDAVNAAGGGAYTLDAEKALCQFAVTNCFNGTYYVNSEDSFDTLKDIVEKVQSETIAKVAVYSAENANMKDMPAYLAAVLASRGELGLLKRVFPRVIHNAKMLCNFVQIVRSGVTGRKSFGTAVKKLVSNWLVNRRPEQLFYDDVGKGNPSIGDIIRMVHPKALTDEQNNMFKYVLGMDFNSEKLPNLVGEFEKFKKDSNGEVPKVPFQCLSNIKLSKSQWKTIAKNMPWNTLRMNLNQLNRHDVFSDKSLVKEIAAKLCDRELVKKFNAFPYQLLTTYQNAKDVPKPIENALHDAMEVATENVESFNMDVAVCIDVSGSMNSPVTGYRQGSSTVTSCRDVAALIASVILRKNKDSIVIPFCTKTHNNVNVSGHDSVMTNSKKLSINGGGTDCACAMFELLRRGEKRDLVIYVSDNMSWYSFSRENNLAKAWADYKAKNKKAKLILIDLTPNTKVQVNPQKDVLNIGGWSDTCFEVINAFVKSGDTDEFVKTVKSIEL